MLCDCDTYMLCASGVDTWWKVMGQSYKREINLRLLGVVWHVHRLRLSLHTQLVCTSGASVQPTHRSFAINVKRSCWNTLCVWSQPTRPRSIHENDRDMEKLLDNKRFLLVRSWGLLVLIFFFFWAYSFWILMRYVAAGWIGIMCRSHGLHSSPPSLTSNWFILLKRVGSYTICDLVGSKQL